MVGMSFLRAIQIPRRPEDKKATQECGYPSSPSECGKEESSDLDFQGNTIFELFLGNFLTFEGTPRGDKLRKSNGSQRRSTEVAPQTARTLRSRNNSRNIRERLCRSGSGWGIPPPAGRPAFNLPAGFRRLNPLSQRSARQPARALRDCSLGSTPRCLTSPPITRLIDPHWEGIPAPPSLSLQLESI